MDEVNKKISHIKKICLISAVILYLEIVLLVPESLAFTPIGVITWAYLILPLFSVSFSSKAGYTVKIPTSMYLAGATTLPIGLFIGDSLSIILLIALIVTYYFLISRYVLKETIPSHGKDNTNGSDEP